MKRAALSQVKDELSKYLRLAEKEEIIITRHGKPADDWFEYRLERDPRFLGRIREARRSLRLGERGAGWRR